MIDFSIRRYNRSIRSISFQLTIFRITDCKKKYLTDVAKYDVKKGITLLFVGWHYTSTSITSRLDGEIGA